MKRGYGAKFGPTLLKGDEAQAVARSAPENLNKILVFLQNRKNVWKKSNVEKN